VVVLTQTGLPNTEARWLDRSGRVVATIPLPAGRWEGLSLSRDGTRLAIERRSSATAVDLWLLGLSQPNPTRFTFGPGINNQPRWSRDGATIAYNSDQSGSYEVYTKPTAGVADARQVTNVRGAFANTADWSSDGKEVIFYAPLSETGWNIWRVAADGSGAPSPVVQGRFNEAGASISPDGRWILYYSDESGRIEAYVQSYPDGGTKVQISNGGCSSSATFLAWTRGGREVMFVALDGYTLMACDVETAPTFRAGVPRRLFRLPISNLGVDVTADGERFITTAAAGESASNAATVIVNWPSLMRARK
jgi:Tol biopolymer transport system component